MISGNFDYDNRDAIWISDPHLDESPGLCHGLAQNANSCRGEPVALRVNVPYLQPDHHRVAGRGTSVSGHLEQSLAKKEHRPGIGRRPELPVDRQAKNIAVEAPAAVQVGRAKQNAAAQNLHTAILPAPLASGHP